MPRPFEDREDVSEDFPYEEIDRRLGGEEPPREIDAAILLEHPQIRVFVAEAIRRVLRLVRADKFPRLQADCIVIAIGGELREDGTTLSMTEVASDWGITKAAVSKRVAKIRETTPDGERIVHRMGDVGWFDADGVDIVLGRRNWDCIEADIVVGFNSNNGPSIRVVGE